MPLDKKEMYGKVAESLISLMRSGVAPWSRPWLVRAYNDPWRPHNGATGREYSGFNSLYLSCLMAANDWRDPRFYTWNNVKSVGGRVRDGQEKEYTLVVYNKRVTKKNDEDPDKSKSFYMMKYYRVYNAEQVEGLDEFVVDDNEPEPYWHEGEEFPVAECVVNSYCDAQKVFVDYGGDRAFYDTVTDRIGMPDNDRFPDLGRFYATLFHEIIHSTGHESRQDRLIKNRFGSGDYAKEELVAEFGAAFLCVNSDVPLVSDQSAAYLKNWADVCEDDPGMLVTAVNAAQRAADFVFDCVDLESVVVK